MYKTKVKLFDEFLRLNLTFIKYFLDLQTIIARVAELVDALDSKSSSFGSVGSIPTSSTNKSKSKLKHKACFFVFVGFYFQSDALGKNDRRALIPPRVQIIPKNNNLFLGIYFLYLLNITCKAIFYKNVSNFQ